jgi:hypothetical protein
VIVSEDEELDPIREARDHPVDRMSRSAAFEAWQIVIDQRHYPHVRAPSELPAVGVLDTRALDFPCVTDAARVCRSEYSLRTERADVVARRAIGDIASFGVDRCLLSGETVDVIGSLPFDRSLIWR